MAGSTTEAIDSAAVNALVAEMLRWFKPARTKHAFDFTVTSGPQPTIVPFTAGRVASLMIPANQIWVGGDAGLTVNNGIGLAAGQILSFGPEEGDSYTFVITTTALAPVDLRCIELLP
jgi:hypothetical protein